MRFEGTGANRLRQAIRAYGFNDYDRFEYATLISVAPTVIKVDHCPIEFDAFDLVMSEHLTERTLRIRNADGSISEMTVLSPLEVGDRLIVASMNDGQKYVVIDRLVAL
ncbi:DUF2577 family protein [Paenibacillus mucilaginosus]|uniref:DUF2577 family protein n=1 Tax=Paenibacillus mucilaginosus TaxID=61624 RepID=UPI003D1C9716